MKKEFEPYGKSWEAAMMKMSKPQLIDFIRRILKPMDRPMIDAHNKKELEKLQTAMNAIKKAFG